MDIGEEWTLADELTDEEAVVHAGEKMKGPIVLNVDEQRALHRLYVDGQALLVDSKYKALWVEYKSQLVGDQDGSFTVTYHLDDPLQLKPRVKISDEGYARHLAKFKGQWAMDRGDADFKVAQLFMASVQPFSSVKIGRLVLHCPTNAEKDNGSWFLVAQEFRESKANRLVFGQVQAILEHLGPDEGKFIILQAALYETVEIYIGDQLNPLLFDQELRSPLVHKKPKTTMAMIPADFVVPCQCHGSELLSKRDEDPTGYRTYQPKLVMEARNWNDILRPLGRPLPPPDMTMPEVLRKPSYS